MRLIDELRTRIMVLDGAMGTMIKRACPKPEDYKGYDGCNDVLNITSPEIIENIHREYIDAGADIIETNTFNCNDLSLKKYGLEGKTYEICLAGANIAKKVADSYKDRKIYVAGSVGPTNMSLYFLSQEKDVDMDAEKEKLKKIYTPQIEGVIDGGADIILLETVYDSLNAQIAIDTVLEILGKKGKELPIFLSATVGEKGRIFSGENPHELFTKLDRKEIAGYGFNCSYGSAKLMDYVRELAKDTDKFVVVYPNAGLPDKDGKYADTPEIMGGYLKELMDSGDINIVGGCCGTTPEYIKIISSCAKMGKLRVVRK